MIFDVIYIYIYIIFSIFSYWVAYFSYWMAYIREPVAELIKSMNEDNLNRILELLNTWWREQNIEEEDLKARVVLIFKKGIQNNLRTTDPFPY